MENSFWSKSEKMVIQDSNSKRVSLCQRRNMKSLSIKIIEDKQPGPAEFRLFSSSRSTSYHGHTKRPKMGVAAWRNTSSLKEPSHAYLGSRRQKRHYVNVPLLVTPSAPAAPPATPITSSTTSTSTPPPSFSPCLPSTPTHKPFSEKPKRKKQKSIKKKIQSFLSFKSK